jgi:hypothetical protein
MKLWKMKKSSDFDHEIMNFVEKNVGTPVIVSKTLMLMCYSLRGKDVRKRHTHFAGFFTHWVIHVG